MITGVLNFFLWLNELLILRPLRLIQKLFTRDTFNKVIHQIYNPDQSDTVKSLSVAFGIFMGILPIWGLQTLIALFAAIALRLNKALVLIFVHISFPPLFPLIIFLSFQTGAFWVNNKVNVVKYPTKISLQNLSLHLDQYLYGSISLAIIAAIGAGLLTYAMLKTIKLVKQLRPEVDAIEPENELVSVLD